MAVSAAKSRWNTAYNKRHDAIMIRPEPQEGQRIRAAAARAGQSVSAYILETLRARMDRDGVPLDATVPGREDKKTATPPKD